MNSRSLIKTVVLGLIAAAAVSFQPDARADWVVKAGYDLFETVAADTSFPGLGNLMGVPLGTFDFGSGPVATGQTDTIVQRLSDITVPPVSGSSGTSPLVMNALQLETVAPVNFAGLGLDNYFVTLDPRLASTGSIDITFTSNAGGTFASTLDVNFDIHKGALNGPVVATSSTVLTSSGTPWGRIPPPGAVTIPGVNQFLLGGTDTSGDFWPNGELHNGPHGVIDALSTPEPSTWVMLVAVGVMVPAYARFRRRGA